MEAWREELYHHGIIGQKWGIRRYQNPDGSLTEKGRKRYLNSDGSLTRAGEKRFGTKRKMIHQTGGNRYQNDDGSLSDEGRKRYVELQQKISKTNANNTTREQAQIAKTTKDLSDDELRAAISRMQLERTYLDLTRSTQAQTDIANGNKQVQQQVNSSNNSVNGGNNQKQKSGGGKSVLGTIFATSATVIGTQLVTYMLGTAVNKTAAKIAEVKGEKANKDLSDAISKLSDEDLDKKLGRMKKEKEFRDLLSAANSFKDIVDPKGKKK